MSKFDKLLLSIVEADEAKVKRIGELLGHSLVIYLHNWYVKRALRELGIGKKRARWINLGAQSALTLAGYSYSAGKLKAQKVFELSEAL